MPSYFSDPYDKTKKTTTPLYASWNHAHAYFVVSYKIFIFVARKFTVNLVHSELSCTVFLLRQMGMNDVCWYF